MLNFWPFNRQRQPERRASASGFTAEVMAARESYISGRRGLGELTATAQACISLWESAFAIAEVKGTRFLDRRTMALIGRSLALRGEVVLVAGEDGLTPAADWDVATRGGVPRAYRVTVSESGGGVAQTVLAAEVVHVRIGSDPVAPWLGTAPLRRAPLTAGMLHAIEAALSEAFENAPIASLIVPFPEAPDADMTAMGRSFRGQRGRVLLRESVSVSAAGGPAPAADWRPSDLSPDMTGMAPAEMLAAARDSVCTAFGILPSLFNASATGPGVREAQRHLVAFVLQPIAELLAEEATEKLGSLVEIDMLTPLQAFDQGGSARAVATLVQAMAQAKEAGLPPETVAGIFGKMDWKP